MIHSYCVYILIDMYEASRKLVSAKKNDLVIKLLTYASHLHSDHSEIPIPKNSMYYNHRLQYARQEM